MVKTAFMAKWFYAVVYNSMHVNICTIVPDFLKPWCDRKLMMNFKPGEYARIRTWYWPPFLRFDYFLKTTTKPLMDQSCRSKEIPFSLLFIYRISSWRFSCSSVSLSATIFFQRTGW